MSRKNLITRDTIDTYLGDLGKVFRKKNGKRTPAEIIIVGGGAVLLNFHFREATEDVDAIIRASSVMKESIFQVAEDYNLPADWVNDDFKYTSSYTTKLLQFSKPYRTFSNVLEVRTILDEYLIATKLMAGRTKKHDLSDILGVLQERKEVGNPISFEDVKKAVCDLYGAWDKLPKLSQTFAAEIFSQQDYDVLLSSVKKMEQEAAFENEEMLEEQEHANNCT